MFFEEHEKRIYSPPNSESKYDPLAVERALRIESGGRLSALIRDWKAGSLPIPEIPIQGNALSISSTAALDNLSALMNQPEGDISGSYSAGVAEKRAVDGALAEAELARVSRVAFSLAAFPETTDAVALEILCDYLEYMEKKGKREEASPVAPTSSPVAPSCGAMKTS
jgi:hypothetical protein